MMDLQAAKAAQHSYYNSTDYIHGINQIEQFEFTDPRAVPELFRNFAVEYFELERYSRVDLEQLNQVLNQLWQGPGSCALISDLIWDIRIARRQGDPAQDALKGYSTPTVDSDLETADE